MVYTLIPGHHYTFNGEVFEYVGVMKALGNVPDRNCLYVLGNALFVRQMIYVEAPQVRPRKDTSRPLKTDIYETDDDLMQISKKLLDGWTLNEFKGLYRSDSEMNNVRRMIEYDQKSTDKNKGNFSWARLRDLIDRMGYEYDLIIFDPKIGRNKNILNDEEEE